LKEIDEITENLTAELKILSEDQSDTFSLYTEATIEVNEEDYLSCLIT